VLNAFVNQPGKEHKGWSILLQAIFGLGGASKIKSLILDSLTTELKKTGQV